MEADVVCVGYGGAGAVAAITAADLGSSVIVIEKQPADTDTEIRHTPNTRSSGAHVVCISDARQGADYIYTASFGRTPRELCEVWAKYATTNEEYIEKLGGKLTPPNTAFRGDYSMFPGWDTVSSRPFVGGGSGLFQMFDENVRKRKDKIRVVYGTPGKELVKDANGVIIGVLAEQDGKPVHIRARKAVVLTAGGFEWDEEMKMNFLHGYPAYFYGSLANTGDGIRMAAKAGAAMWHFNSVFGQLTAHMPGYPGFKNNLPERSIYVNKYGKRFFRERTYPSNALAIEACVFDNAKGVFPAIPCWAILDEPAFKRGSLLMSSSKGSLPGGKPQSFYTFSKDYADEIKSGFIVKADTIEELASKIAADAENGGLMTPEALRATLDRYNQFCEAKKDADFDRTPSTMIAVSAAPYYAIKLYPGGAMTTGGPKKNVKAQVLDAFNNPIPHLYCAGEMGASHGLLYPIPGCNIGDLLIFGRVAGENAVKEVPA